LEEITIPATNTLSTLHIERRRSTPVYPRMTLLSSGKIFLSEPSKGTQFVQSGDELVELGGWSEITLFANAQDGGKHGATFQD
jgi:hypothetical protein